MSAQQLITEHIDLWTSTVKAKNTQGRGSSKKRELYGIKKLRELILELAVRGKLVPQDPNDEPASGLLKRIAAEKEQLIKDKKVKKQKSLPAITDEEKPFDLPLGWEWLHLADAGHDLGQKTPEDIFTYIDVGAINKELGIISESKILNADEAPSRARKIVKNGTVIYSTVRPYLLNIAVINDDFYPEPIASTAFAILHPFSGLAASFIYRYLRSPAFITYVESVQTGIAYPAINDKLFFSGVLPIPPTSEQHRIVAKVDELMALCDQLEQQAESSLDVHNVLVDTLLSTLTDARDDNKFSDNWERLAEHIDALITTDYAVDQLKQSILQLAVQGKLVPQDPSDEPAKELLKRIAAEKEQLIKDKKIKKQKPQSKICNEEKPFELPRSWEWVRLEALTQLITKGSSPKWQGVAYTENPEDVLFVTSENVGVNELLLEKKKFVERKFNEVEPRSILSKGDMLMNIVGGSIGRTAIYDIEVIANINQAVCLIRVFEELIDKDYLLKFFNSETCRGYMFDKQVDNARANLSMGSISRFVIPFPSFSEQQRIVSKVNELMTLCDQLKAKLHDAQTTQLHLSDAVVESVLTV